MPKLIKKALLDKLKNKMLTLKGSNNEILKELNKKPIIGKEKAEVTPEALIPLIKNIDITKAENTELLWIIDKVKNTDKLSLDNDTVDKNTLEKMVTDQKISQEIVTELNEIAYKDVLGISWGETSGIGKIDIDFIKQINTIKPIDPIDPIKPIDPIVVK